MRTLEDTPTDATHWSTCDLALKVGISASSVGRIWRAFGLKPWLTDTFKLSEDPLFVEKVRDVVGLYKKTGVFRTEKRRNPITGAAYPWLVRRSAIVNHFYVYAVDDDFSPFFIKFCTYFPYNAKVCLNGNEWAKRQAAKAGVAFEPLDNGFVSCADPKRLQRICDRLDAEEDRPVRAQVAGPTPASVHCRGSPRRLPL